MNTEAADELPFRNSKIRPTAISSNIISSPSYSYCSRLITRLGKQVFYGNHKKSIAFLRDTGQNDLGRKRKVPGFAQGMLRLQIRGRLIQAWLALTMLRATHAR